MLEIGITLSDPTLPTITRRCYIICLHHMCPMYMYGISCISPAYIKLVTPAVSLECLSVIIYQTIVI